MIAKLIRVSACSACIAGNARGVRWAAAILAATALLLSQLSSVAQVGGAWPPAASGSDDPYGSINNTTYGTLYYSSVPYRIEWVSTWAYPNGTGTATATAAIDVQQNTAYAGFVINGSSFLLSGQGASRTYSLDVSATYSASTDGAGLYSGIVANTLRYVDLNITPGTSSGWNGTVHATYDAVGTSPVEYFPYFKYKVTVLNVASNYSKQVDITIAQGGTQGVGYVNIPAPGWRVQGTVKPADFSTSPDTWWTTSHSYDTGVHGSGGDSLEYWLGSYASSDQHSLVKYRVGDVTYTATLTAVSNGDGTYNGVGYVYVRALPSTSWSSTNAPQSVSIVGSASSTPAHGMGRIDVELVPLKITNVY